MNDDDADEVYMEDEGFGEAYSEEDETEDDNKASSDVDDTDDEGVEEDGKKKTKTLALYLSLFTVTVSTNILAHPSTSTLTSSSNHCDTAGPSRRCAGCPWLASICLRPRAGYSRRNEIRKHPT